VSINDQNATGWACDVPVSMPEPINASDVLLDMGDRAFTAFGLFHNLTRADVEEIARPTYGPQELA
jgi:hypothetical protein